MNCDLITLTFQDESAAERGHAILRDLIKLVYGEEKGLLPEQAGQKKLWPCQKFFLYRSLIRDYDPDPDFPGRCPIRFLERKGNTVTLKRCADLQTSMNFIKPATDEFFISLCEILAFDEPDTPFEAKNEFEESVSCTQQDAALTYQNRTFHLVIESEVDGDYDERIRTETDKLTWQLLEEFGM